MLKTLYIQQHNALGDQIVCNGLCRELIESKRKEGYNQFVIWTYDWLVPTIGFMYRDIEGVDVRACPGHADRQSGKGSQSDGTLGNLLMEYYTSNNVSHDHIMALGTHTSHNCLWDEGFYVRYNISFKKRWTSFFVKRDPEREESLYKKLNPDNEPYIIIHNRFNVRPGDLINYSKITSNLKRIEIAWDQTDNAFDYLKLLEDADEIHVCDSGFKIMIDSFNYFAKNLFLHDTPPRNESLPHNSRKIWIRL